MSLTSVRSSGAVNNFIAAETHLSNNTRSIRGTEETIITIFELLSSRIVVVVPPFMNFFPDCEDGGPSLAVLRGFEPQLIHKKDPSESAHKVLDLVKHAYVASSESGAEVAVGPVVGPPVLMRAVPHLHSLVGDAGERHTHEVGLGDYRVLVNRVSGCQGRDGAPHRVRRRLFEVRLAQLTAHSEGVSARVIIQVGKEARLVDSDLAPACERAGDVLCNRSGGGCVH